MTPTETDDFTATVQRPWRRVAFAACDECGWHLAIRDYRSRRKSNATATLRAGASHAAETGHNDVRVGVGHF